MKKNKQIPKDFDNMVDKNLLRLQQDEVNDISTFEFQEINEENEQQ